MPPPSSNAAFGSASGPGTKNRASVAKDVRGSLGNDEPTLRFLAVATSQSLGDASPRATDNLWYIVVGTFAVVVLGGVLALVILILKGKSTEVITPLVTLAIGVLGGLLAPSPTKSSG
jgi:hypothetical protein